MTKNAAALSDIVDVGELPLSEIVRAAAATRTRMRAYASVIGLLPPILARALERHRDREGWANRTTLDALVMIAAAEPERLDLVTTFLEEVRASGAPWHGVHRPDEHRPKKDARPRCGARCRSKGGAPCVAPVVVRRDGEGHIVCARRCRMHGGLSTGPKTEAGRERSREGARRGGRERWRRVRAGSGTAGADKTQ